MEKCHPCGYEKDGACEVAISEVVCKGYEIETSEVDILLVLK